MAEDRLQAQRFELKYIIPEDVALAVRDFVAGYLDVDEYAASMPNFSYPVHSLYVDSDNLELYNSTINGDKNRFKLRLRFYENRPSAPIFFEIKRRMNNTISKQRGGVKREAVDSLLHGQYPGLEHLASEDPKQLVAVQRFCQLASELNVKPKTHVAYWREAWLSRHDNSVRVTMDRCVRSQVESTARLVTEMEDPVVVFGDSVVLELKFTNRLPEWFKDLTRVFNLVQCGAAKYVDGVTKIGKARVNLGFVPETVSGATNSTVSCPHPRDA